MINLNAILLHKFVQFVPLPGIEIDGRNWDRSWVTVIGIEVWLQEPRLKMGYRNWQRRWVTGIEIEVGDEVAEIEVTIELRLVDVKYCC